MIILRLRFSLIEYDSEASTMRIGNTSKTMLPGGLLKKMLKL